MMCIHTRGFASLLHRTDHFLNHGARLGLATEEDYEAFADEFFRNPCASTAQQFVRPKNGDLVRYDGVLDVFAVLGKDRFIRTCYKPDTAFHGERTNLDYYLSEKAKA